MYMIIERLRYQSFKAGLSSTFFLAIMLIHEYCCPTSVYAKYLGIWGDMDLKYEQLQRYSRGNSLREDTSFAQNYNFFSGIEGNIYNQNSGPYAIYFKYNHLRYDTDIDGTNYSPAQSALSWDGHMSLYISQLKDLMFILDKYDRADLYGITRGGALNQDIHESSFVRTSMVLSFGNNGGPRYYASHLIEHTDQRSQKILDNIAISSGNNAIILDEWRLPEIFSSNYQTIRTLRVGQISYKNYIASARSGISKAHMQQNWYRLSNWLEATSLFTYENGFLNDEWERMLRRIDFALRGTRSKWSFQATPYYLTTQDKLQTSSASYALPLTINYSPSQYEDYALASHYLKARTESITEHKEYSSIQEVARVTYQSRANSMFESVYQFDQSNSPELDNNKHRLDVLGSLRQKDNYWLEARYNLQMTDSDEKDLMSPNPDKSSLTNRLSIDGAKNFGDMSVRLGQTIQRGEEKEQGAATRKSSEDRTFIGISGAISDQTHASLQKERIKRSDFDGNRSRIDLLEVNLSSSASISQKMSMNLNASHKENTEKSNSRTEIKKTEDSYASAALLYDVSSGVRSTTNVSKKASKSVDEKSNIDTFGETISYIHYTNGFSARRPYLQADAGIIFLQETGSRIRDEETYKLSLQVFPKLYAKYGADYELTKYGPSTDMETIKLFFEYKLPSSTFEGSYWRREYNQGDYGNNYLQVHFKRYF